MARFMSRSKKASSYGYGSIAINTNDRGKRNIHLPAIWVFTRGTAWRWRCWRSRFKAVQLPPHQVRSGIRHMLTWPVAGRLEAYSMCKPYDFPEWIAHFLYINVYIILIYIISIYYIYIYIILIYHIHIYIHIYIYIYIHIYIYINTYIIHIYIYILIHTYIYIYININITHYYGIAWSEILRNKNKGKVTQFAIIQSPIHISVTYIPDRILWDPVHFFVIQLSSSLFILVSLTFYGQQHIWYMCLSLHSTMFFLGV